MRTRKFAMATLLPAALLGGCQSMGGFGGFGGFGAQQAKPIASNVNGTGTIQSVDAVSRSEGLGLGTLAGAAVGGVLGSQVGSGGGNVAATAAGVAGGAYVGHQMEKQGRPSGQIYKVTIRMDDGSTQSFAQEAKPQVVAGDRVRIVNGVLSKM